MRDIRGKDLIVAIGGGILFMAIWILLEILFTSQTVMLICTGLAWFGTGIAFWLIKDKGEKSQERVWVENESERTAV